MGKILLIDRDKTSSDILKLNLGLEGYDVISTRDCDAAQNLIDKEEIDLIIMDILAPEKEDGVSFCQKIKSDKKTKNTPLIVLSSIKDDFLKIKSWKLGVYDFILKPFNLIDLVEIIRETKKEEEKEAICPEKATSVFIVGGGALGTYMLKLLLTDPKVKILGMADKDLSAPGILLAKELGIATTNNFSGIFKKENLDIILSTDSKHTSVLALYGSETSIEIMGEKTLHFLLNQLDDKNKIAKNEKMLAKKLTHTSQNFIRAFLEAIDARDSFTHHHTLAVAKISRDIAEAMGLSSKQIEVIEKASLLHDLGKIGVDDSILKKSGPLSGEEKKIIQNHPLVGAKILEKIEGFQEIIPLIKHQYEKYDGSGFPDGLKEKVIPLGARIINVADSFSALISKRSYREALSLEEAKGILAEQRGLQFDPEIVDALFKILEKNPFKYDWQRESFS